MSSEQEQAQVAGFIGDSGQVFSLPEEIKVEEPPEGTKQNVTDNQAALDALDFIRKECSEQLCPRFWEVIRDSAIAEVGLPLIACAGKPMDDVRAKSFLEELVPYGKYSGTKVKTVLKKDRKHLQDLVTKPDRFQKALSRYFVWEFESQKKQEGKKSS